MTSSRDRVRVCADSAIWRAIDGEIFVFAVKSSRRFKITGSGSLLWKAIVDGSTEPELVDLLRQHYNIRRSAAEKDVHEFLRLCDERSVLE